jgi:hypothetical protein
MFTDVSIFFFFFFCLLKKISLTDLQSTMKGGYIMKVKLINFMVREISENQPESMLTHFVVSLKFFYRARS